MTFCHPMCRARAPPAWRDRSADAVPRWPAHAEAHQLFKSVWLAENVPSERGVFPTRLRLRSWRRSASGSASASSTRTRGIRPDRDGVRCAGRTRRGTGGAWDRFRDRRADRALGISLSPPRRHGDAIPIVRALLRRAGALCGPVFSADDVAPAVPAAAAGDADLHGGDGRARPGAVRADRRRADRLQHVPARLYATRGWHRCGWQSRFRGGPGPGLCSTSPASSGRTATRRAHRQEPRSVPCSRHSGRLGTIGRRCATRSFDIAGLRRRRWWRAGPACAAAEAATLFWTIG